MIDDLALRQSLRACRTDIIRVEDFQHVGPGVTHERSDTDDDQCDDRQHQMVRAVPELAGCRQVLVVSSDESAQVEPAELDAEQEFQQGCEEEGGQRETCQRHDRDRVVHLGILLGRCDDAERDRDDDLKDERNAAHDEGDPDGILKFVHYGDGPSPTVPEIAADRSSAPCEEAGNDPLVHAVGGAQLLHPLVETLGTGLHGLLPCDLLQVRSGQAAHQHINDERDEDQYEYGYDQSLDNILSHGYTSGS